MATILSSELQANPGDLTTNTVAANANLGARVEDRAGNVYRYAKAGAADLVAGTLLQSPAQVAAHIGINVAAAAVGATSVTISSSITTTANQYAGGWLVVASGTGIGQRYLISGNTAVTGATGCVITLSDPLLTALAASGSSTVTLMLNPFNGVIINPTTATGAPVGVAVNVITAGNHGWIQVSGVASVLSKSGTTVGLEVGPSTATAGAVATATSTQPMVGTAAQTLTDGANGLVMLSLV